MDSQNKKHNSKHLQNYRKHSNDSTRHDIEITEDSKSNEKQYNQKLIRKDSQTNKQKYRQNNFVVGAGHAFFMSDAQTNFDDNNDDEDSSYGPSSHKIGKKLFNQQNYTEESEIKGQKKQSQQQDEEEYDYNNNNQQIDLNDIHGHESKEIQVSQGKLSLIQHDNSGNKLVKLLPWICILLSVILGAAIPTWILHYPAKKYLRICWRYFMTSFWLLPLLCWEIQQPHFKRFYTFSNIFKPLHLKKIMLSALGSSLWFGFVLFSFDYTAVSHAYLLGNIQNFFLSIWRIYFKKQKSLEIEILGQVLIFIGIVLIIMDSITRDHIQMNGEHFIMTNHLLQPIWKRIIFGDFMCICVSVLMCKFSLIETEVKSIYPPYLQMFLICIFSTFFMVIISWLVEFTNLSSEGVSGWTDIFMWENLVNYLILTLFIGLGLLISYMYVGKYFQPVISGSIFLYEPIVATIFIYMFGIEMLPGPFACLGYVFQIPGMFLIILTRHILQQQERKNRKKKYKQKQAIDDHQKQTEKPIENH